ncbi:MAG: PspC domain-containing protein [Cytophagales bacterium]|nr:MAG: PspC domain-containing protein [Cytophagales bacterium]TAF61242.1 MAG: PspC domain-containing protein [Cytophagales bacterium]
MLNRIQSFLETSAFGVCTALGEIMGISTESIRLFFIRLSFFTFGSPIIIYLGMAFVLEMRKHLRLKSKQRGI